jgi:hypothetical protein
MDAEQLTAELIEALGELRAQVIQIGASERSVRDDLILNGQLMNVFSIFHRLSTIRAPRSDVENLPKLIRISEQDTALAEALQAINPDYAVEAIETAIGVATSQRADAVDLAMDSNPTDWGGDEPGWGGDERGPDRDERGWGGDERGWGGDEKGP